MLVDTENPSPWMRAIQAARYCNRSEGGWSRLIKQGKAPRSHKVCGLRMYHRDDLDAWMRGQKEVRDVG